jgi:hypothetical protein
MRIYKSNVVDNVSSLEMWAVNVNPNDRGKAIEEMRAAGAEIVGGRWGRVIAADC